MAIRDDPPHLSAVARQALDFPVEDRVFHIRQDRWIGYAAANEALVAMLELARRPRTTTSPSMLVLGRAGNGKTTIIERFAKTYPPRTREPAALTNDVVTMSIPAGAAEKDFWAALLHACAIPHRANDPVQLLRSQAYFVLESLQPRVLIGDEFNNLIIASSGANQRLIMARIRELTNKLKVHLVFAGTEEAQRAAYNDPQLDRRLEHFLLPRWSLDLEFLKLLRTLETQLPLPEPSNLATEKMATLIDLRTDGTIGSIVRLVKEAAVLAVRDGRDRINLEILQSIRANTSEERQHRAERI